MPPASHTHNYAGSSSAGGSANSAVKLDSSAGSSSQPVYFSSGKPVACGYTINTSVPSGAKFTDTNTWRDIKINNVSIGSHTLDLRNGSNTTLTNTNGVVTINSTWRPVVDNLTSDSTTEIGRAHV